MLSFTRQMDYVLNYEWASNKYYFENWSEPILLSPKKGGFQESKHLPQTIAILSCTVLCCKCALLTPTCGVLRQMD